LLKIAALDTLYSLSTEWNIWN